MKTLWIVPHTHFDVEVFLTQEETLQRALPHITAALDMLERHEEYRFVLDQTCYVAPYLRRFPEMRARMERFIAEGRLEVACGMVSMPDVNMPSGESFIRQVLLGKGYYRETFGVDVPGGWLIDSFGQHPQTPQLMRKCGFDWHVFQRVRPQRNPSEFQWRGIDGSELLCHWMPHGYVALYAMPGTQPEFDQALEDRLAFLELHAQTDNILALAGSDLEPPDPGLPARIAAFAESHPETELKFATAGEYFKALAAHAGELPVTEDDLNPVFQGCYSARIGIKKRNRALENRLVTAEKTAAIASGLGAPSRYDRIGEAWAGVNFNQFHDIICGCLVDKAFRHVMERYDVSEHLANSALGGNLDALATAADTRGEGAPILVFNPLAWQRDDAVECEAAFAGEDVRHIELRDSRGNVIPADLRDVRRYGNGAIQQARLVFVARGVPALGYEIYHAVPADAPRQHESPIASSHPWNHVRNAYDVGFMENECVRLDFDLWTGAMLSVRDKRAGREVIDPDRPWGNVLIREQDFGNFWQYNGPCKGDAFSPLLGLYPPPAVDDPKADYSTRYGGDGRVVQGAAHAEFVIEFPFGSGFYASRVRVYAGLPRIDIRTTLINQDERVRYRAAFPLAAKNAQAAYEIPFGAIERPAGEFPAQNWVDASDGVSGLALLNRGLPGNNLIDDTLLLSLMKCTAIKEGYGEVGGFRLSTPTETGYEKGVRHEFDYALLPHSGDWREAACYRSGHEFNTPLIAVKATPGGGSLPARMSFAAVTPRNAVLSALKPSEQGVIVRVYEAAGKPVKDARCEFAWPIASAEETDLIERPFGAAAKHDGKTLTFDLGPFEIKSFRLQFSEWVPA